MQPKTSVVRQSMCTVAALKSAKSGNLAKNLDGGDATRFARIGRSVNARAKIRYVSKVYT